MKIKIVCWGTEEDIFNAIDKRGLYETFGEKYKKSYHLIEGNKVEVVTLDEDTSLLYKECSKKIADQITALFIDYEDERKSEIIQTIKSINKNIMILEKCNSIKLINNNHNENIKYIHFVREQFNINLIVHFILDNCDSRDENYGLAGFEQSEISYEDLIRDILNNICSIKDYKNIQLNLHLKTMLGIEELAYMEDILKEYITENSMLIIKQYILKNIDNNIYFDLIYR